MDVAQKTRHRRKRFVPLGEFTYLLERYNRCHGTHYTYGKAVALLECGMIPRFEFSGGRINGRL